VVLEAFPTTLKLAAITMTMAVAPAGLGAHGSGKVRTNAKSVSPDKCLRRRLRTCYRIIDGVSGGNTREPHLFGSDQAGGRLVDRLDRGGPGRQLPGSGRARSCWRLCGSRSRRRWRDRRDCTDKGGRYKWGGQKAQAARGCTSRSMRAPPSLRTTESS
jgi:hypothetical protein